MNKATVAIWHFVEFMYPGTFVSEYESKRTPSRCTRGIAVPEGAFGFRVYDRLVAEVVYEGKHHLLQGSRLRVSGVTYIGELFGVERVRREVPDNKILLANMKCNGWEAVVKTRCGNFQNLQPEDTVIARAP